uniref:Uncharacterized protein n=1 Tax=Romanomermis culicivorax TaxID=13658 RepID=A0A915HZC0_ROMCU
MKIQFENHNTDPVDDSQECEKEIELITDYSRKTCIVCTKQKLVQNLVQFRHVLEQMYHIRMVLSVVLPRRKDEKMEWQLATFWQKLK